MISAPLRRVSARVPKPTLRGVAVGAVGVVTVILAYVFGRTELLMMGWFAILLLVAAVLFVWLRRMRMTVKRSFPSTAVIAGHLATATLEIRNLSRSASAEGGWQEILPWAPFGTPLERLPALPAVGRTWNESVATLRYEIIPPRRGVCEVGPFVITLSDPFGLARSEVVVGGTEHIAVIPDVEQLPLGGITAIADDGSAQAQRFRALGGDDDVTTRNYRSGDALRRVHWRASAHRGELMVREEEQRSHAEACVMLDTTRTGYSDFRTVSGPDEPQSERFEWALRIAATLALHLEQRGFLVQVVETGAQQLGQPEHVDSFLESVAAVTLCPFPAPHGHASSRDSRPFQSLGVVFAVVADADEATIETLTAQRRGFEIAVALVIPGSQDGAGRSVDGTSTGAGGRDADGSDGAANEDVVIERLTAAGWRCVEAPQAESVVPLWSLLAPLLERGHAHR